MMTMDKATEVAKGLKEARWEDLLPMLHLFRRGTREDVVVALVTENGPVTWAAVRSVVENFQPLEGVMMVMDSYVQSVQGTAQLPNRQHGDLGEAWRAGQREGISEMLSVVVAYPDGRAEHRLLPYSSETKEWGEPMDMDDATVGGPMANALISALTGKEAWL